MMVLPLVLQDVHGVDMPLWDRDDRKARERSGVRVSAYAQNAFFRF